MLEEYNRGVLFGNNPGAMAREIATLGLDAEIEGKLEKSQVSARGKYLATAFMLISDRRRYGELISLLKNDYTKQQKNYPRNLTDMYGLMVAFDPARSTPVSGGRKKGTNFGNVAVEPGTGGDRNHGDGGSTSRNIECWRCGGYHMKRDCPLRAKDKENKKIMGKTTKINALR